MFTDVNAFITELEKRRELARVTDVVDPNLEISALVDKASKSPGGGPALLFEKPAGHTMPVAANLYGSMTRICLALGVTHLDELAREIEDLTTPPMPRGFMDALKMMPLVGRLSDLMPKTVSDAPCQETVRPDGGLDELPVLTTWPEDGGPFITLPLVITRDPGTGVRNIGTYRMQVYDRRTTGMHWQRHKGGAQHYRVAERLGQRLEVAVALGADPVLQYAASSAASSRSSTGPFVICTSRIGSMCVPTIHATSRTSCTLTSLSTTMMVLENMSWPRPQTACMILRAWPG